MGFDLQQAAEIDIDGEGGDRVCEPIVECALQGQTYDRILCVHFNEDETIADIMASWVILQSSQYG